jgi:hypothetical protein
MAGNLVERVKEGWERIGRRAKLAATGLAFVASLAAPLAAQNTTQVNVHVEDKKQAPIENVFTKISQDEITHDSTWTDYNGDGTLIISTVGVIDDPYTPITFSLSQNYPNPWNPSTTIHFSTTSKGYFVIHDLLGREVAGGEREGAIPGAGIYAATWGGANNSGLNVATGIYFYSIITHDGTKTKKMILLGHGSGGKLSISGTPQQVNRSLGKTADNQYQLSFEKDNMTNVYLPVTINMDTTINKIVNVGPSILDTIPTQLLNVGDTMTVDMDDFVYNDETGLYIPRDSANFDIEANIVSYIAAQPDTLDTWIDIIDSTDDALRDSLLLRVMTPYITTSLFFDMPGTITIDEDTDIDTLIENLNDYVLPAGQNIAFNLLSQSNPGLINLVLSNYSILVDSLRQNGHGESMFRISASNADTTATDSTLLRVLGVNDPPEQVADIPNQTIIQGDTLTLIMRPNYVIDADNDFLYYLIPSDIVPSQVTGDTVKIIPSQDFSGTIDSVQIYVADNESQILLNPFSLEVTPLPPVNVAFKFIAVYDDTLLTSGTSTLMYRLMASEADTTFAWDTDSVKTSEDGIITAQFIEGASYSVRARHTGEKDFNYKLSYYKIPGLVGTVAQEGPRTTYVDSINVMSFEAGTDTVEVLKMLESFPINDLRPNIDPWWEGIRRVADSAAVNLPFRGNLNYTPPDSAQQAWAQELIGELDSIPQIDLNGYYYESTENPTVPWVDIAFDSSFQYASNSATFDPQTNEISLVSAAYKPYVTKKSFKQEIMEGIVDAYDVAGVSPVWVSSSASGAHLTTLGKQAICIVYLSKPKTIFY